VPSFSPCNPLSGELGDRVAEHGQRDLGADREDGVVDPFAGERGDRPGADEELTLPVDDEAESAAWSLLVRVGRAIESASSIVTRAVSIPCSRACAAVRPTAAISGSEKATRGTAR